MTQVHTGNAHRQIVDGQRVRGISPPKLSLIHI